MPRNQPPLSVTRSGPGFGAVLRAMGRVRASEVFVGIPSDRVMRRGDEMNNASLLFIHTHGSPLRNIPPRPVIEPALRTVAKPIAAELAKAAVAEIRGDSRAALIALKRTGIIGSNAAKRWFTNPENHWAPNAPSTIRAKGSDQPLIDTGQMRRAITYVVKQAVAVARERGNEGDERAAAEEAGENVAADSGIAAQAAEGVAEAGLAAL